MNSSFAPQQRPWEELQARSAAGRIEDRNEEEECPALAAVPGRSRQLAQTGYVAETGVNDAPAPFAMLLLPADCAIDRSAQSANPVKAGDAADDHKRPEHPL
jgi:hypothetical protein